MTVIELRKLAKEKHVRLGAGLSKDGIIQKLTAALAGESTEEATEQVVEETPAAAPETEAKEPAAQEEETPAVQTAQQTSQEAPAREERTASAHFKAAWHNPSPRYSAKPAYQAPASPAPSASGFSIFFAACLAGEKRVRATYRGQYGYRSDEYHAPHQLCAPLWSGRRRPRACTIRAARNGGVPFLP